MAQNYLLYRATTPGQLNECRYSLLKYLAVYNLKPPADIEVIIHTDEPAVFESYATFFSRFEMKPSSTASRLELLQTLLKDGASILHLDTDTYPTEPVEELFKWLQDKRVFLLNKAMAGKNLQANPSQKIVLEGKQIDLTPSLQNCQAAAVGLSYDENLLQRLREIEQGLHQQSIKNEDLPFCYLFSQLPAVGFKGLASYATIPEFKQLLQFFFEKNSEESIPNLVKRVQHLNFSNIAREKLEFEQLPFYKKWLQKITGKGWSIRQYENKF